MLYVRGPPSYTAISNYLLTRKPVYRDGVMAAKWIIMTKYVFNKFQFSNTRVPRFYSEERVARVRHENKKKNKQKKNDGFRIRIMHNTVRDTRAGENETRI